MFCGAGTVNRRGSSLLELKRMKSVLGAIDKRVPDGGRLS